MIRRMIIALQAVLLVALVSGRIVPDVFSECLEVLAVIVLCSWPGRKQ